MHARAGGYMVGAGVHIYIYIYICLWTKNFFLNRTLAIDSPFQTFAVGQIYMHTPKTLSSLSKSRISIFNAHITLFVQRMM